MPKERRPLLVSSLVVTRLWFVSVCHVSSRLPAALNSSSQNQDSIESSGPLLDRDRINNNFLTSDRTHCDL